MDPLARQWSSDSANHRQRNCSNNSVVSAIEQTNVAQIYEIDQSTTTSKQLIRQLSNVSECAEGAILILPSTLIPSNEHTLNEDSSQTTLRMYHVPLLRPQCGAYCLDVRQLLQRTGIATFDPGFQSTASCSSAITFIDGPKGLLLHRGYRIQDLCDNLDVEELSFLLMYGELPCAADKAHHTKHIRQHTLVHEKMCQFYTGFRYNAHPMAIMCAVVAALSSFYHNELDIGNAEHRLLAAYRMIAKMPTLAAMAYKTSIGQPIMYPQNAYSYAENLLYMMFAVPSEPYHINKTVAKAMEKFLMLHADHGQNASTSTVRIAGSSQANPYACIASGITALWGPAHGGANEAVIRMLQEIKCVENIPIFIAKAKDKSDPFRLMGFGHRVYKNYDPRAKVMREMCHQLLEDLSSKTKMAESANADRAKNEQQQKLLSLAMDLEKAALDDEYFRQRRLFPNVDFYSGIALRAMGIPVSMFTVLFAVARTIGWVSNWKEMIEDPKQRIGRPRQLYTGSEPRNITRLAERSKVLSGSWPMAQ